MKILHFLVGRCNPDSANGVDKTVYYLLKEFGKNSENSVHLISISNKEPIPIDNVQVHSFSPSRFPFFLSNKIKEKINQINPDVVHLHSVYIPQNIILAWYLYKLDIPYVTTPNGGLARDILNRMRTIKYIYKYLFELPYHNKAAFVHSVGDTENILSYGVKSKIYEIPNGIDLNQIPQIDIDSADELIKKYPMLENKKIMLYLGRLDPLHKGLDLMLKSFEKAKLENTILIIIGPDYKGSLRKLTKLVKDLKISKSVIFTGPVYGLEKFKYLKHADIFIHTSRWEGLPLSVLEAMGMSLPCIVTPAANPLNLIKTKVSGWETDLDIINISKCMNEAGNCSRNELINMGVRNLNIIKQHFSWPMISESLWLKYQQINRPNTKIIKEA